MVREKVESRMALEVFPLIGCDLYRDGENWEDLTGRRFGEGIK